MEYIFRRFKFVEAKDFCWNIFIDTVYIGYYFETEHTVHFERECEPIKVDTLRDLLVVLDDLPEWKTTTELITDSLNIYESCVMGYHIEIGLQVGINHLETKAKANEPES